MRLTCPQHGAFEGYARTGDGAPPIAQACPRCCDEQYRREEESRKAVRRKQAEQQLRSRKMREIVAAADIPARFRDAGLDEFVVTLPQQRLALGVCRAFAETWPEQMNKGGTLVFTGQPGTGKTLLSSGIANQVMAQHMATVRYGTVSSLIRSVRATYGGRGEKTEVDAMAALERPDLLIIDEVGAQNGTSHELQLLFEVIDARYRQLRPTILISNLNAEELEEFVGHRAMDRFAECGPVLAFAWESHRTQKVAS